MHKLDTVSVVLDEVLVELAVGGQFVEILMGRDHFVIKHTPASLRIINAFIQFGDDYGLQGCALVGVNDDCDEVLSDFAIGDLIFLHVFFLLDLVRENSNIIIEVGDNEVVFVKGHLADGAVCHLDGLLALQVSPQKHIPVDAATYHIGLIHHRHAGH